jgi:GntR family transcriptional regulator
MEIEIDFRSKIPLSKQVRQAIKARIEANALLPGDQLPTVRQLAAQLDVNFNTVARAYRELDQSGLITTRQGRGTFILAKLSTPNGPEVASSQNPAQQAAALARAALRAAADAGVEPAELMLEILRQSQRPEREEDGESRKNRHARKKRTARPANASRLPFYPSNRRTGNKRARRKRSCR